MKISVIIIHNSQNQFFIHQRKSDKKTFPNLYGLGAGGKIDENETPLQAAIRELKEETELDTKVNFLFDINFSMEDISYPIFIHETYTDSEILIDESEWQWSGWASMDEVDKLLIENKLCPDTAIFYKIYKEKYL